MKYSIFTSLFFLFSTFFAGAQMLEKQATITVTGAAEIRVQPDEVVLSLDVSKQHKDLQIAKKANDESVAKILEVTRRYGILPQNVQTNYIAVDMKYESIGTARGSYSADDFETEKRVFRGYVVSKTVMVRLTDITKFEEFFSEVLKTGLSEVRNVQFETSKFREHRDKAREQAMKAAKEKATALAAAIGQTIGKAIQITENGGQSHFSPMQNVMNFSGGAGSFSEGSATFAPGSIKVDAQVSVVFELK